MSRKDYQALASAIHVGLAHARYEYTAGGQRTTAAEVGAREDSVRFVRDRIAHVLAMDNGRFDHARFIEACETGHTKGMRRP